MQSPERAKPLWLAFDERYIWDRRADARVALSGLPRFSTIPRASRWAVPLRSFGTERSLGKMCINVRSGDRPTRTVLGLFTGPCELPAQKKKRAGPITQR